MSSPSKSGRDTNAYASAEAASKLAVSLTIHSMLEAVLFAAPKQALVSSSHGGVIWSDAAPLLSNKSGIVIYFWGPSPES